MKLEQLQHFIAIAEHGSLRAAAKRLLVAQPALTRSLKALEIGLGCALFKRASTGMTLSDAGQRFHIRASNILNEERRARDEIAQYDGDKKGSVVVALSIMPHIGMLSSALKPFRKRYPNIKLQIIEGLLPDVEVQLREGSVDFYLGAAPLAHPAPGLTVQKLFDNRRTVVCRQGHPLANARSLKALQHADWAITGVDYQVEDDIVKLFATHQLAPPKVTLRASSAMSMMVSLAHSDMLAMLPMQWKEFPLTKDTLQIIKIREVLPAPAVVIIRRPDYPLTPAAEHFSDLLQRASPKLS